MSFKKPKMLLPVMLALACVAHGAEAPYRISGQGWTQIGRIGHVTDTLQVNLNGNSIQSAGAQFTAIANIGDNWEGAFGFGGYQWHSMEGSDRNAGYMRFKLKNFITEARMMYFVGDKGNPDLSLSFGNFDYNYNPDVKNLGLYLLRGTIYPGFLVSGFMDPAIDLTQGDILGLKLHKTWGKTGHDVIFANERQFPPAFDWSLAYIGKYRPVSAWEIGLGANLYRILPANSKLTTPGKESYATEGDLVGSGSYRPYDGKFIEIDTAGSAGNPALWDTIPYTLQGTKLMAMATLDLKEAFGLGGTLGPEDLKVYAEAALIGVKNYGSIYSDRSQRIPVVGGVNIPAFGWLDVLSLEVEWYGARYRNDIAKLMLGNKSAQPSPIPMSYKDYTPINKGGGLDSQGRLVNDTTIHIRGTALDIENMDFNHWKWSLYARKTVRDHVRFTAQVANDHFRPSPARANTDTDLGGTAEAFSSLKDWYFMFRMGYFF